MSSCPSAPTVTVRAPSFASVTAVPPAAPAGDRRISSISAPPCPSGIASTGRPSTSRMCAPNATTSGTRGPVPELLHLTGHVGELLLAQDGRLADLRRVPVQAAGPLEQQRALDRSLERRPAVQGAVVLHQRRGPALDG